MSNSIRFLLVVLDLKGCKQGCKKDVKKDVGFLEFRPSSSSSWSHLGLCESEQASSGQEQVLACLTCVCVGDLVQVLDKTGADDHRIQQVLKLHLNS